jgi:hypothetical protein
MITRLDEIKNDPVMKFVLSEGIDSTCQRFKWERKKLEDYIIFTSGKYNPEYFEKYNLKIQTKAGTLISLIENPVQKKIQACIDSQAGKPIRIKIPKARRHGVSTKVQAVFYNDIFYGKNMQCLTVCHDMESARNMRMMFERYNDNIPMGRLGFKKTSEKMWKLQRPKDIGYLIDTADELDTGRSFTYHRMHLSEVAFYRKPEILMTGLLTAVDKNPNTMIIAESTANGMGGWWYDFVMNKNEYQLLFFAWFEDGGNTLQFESDKEKSELERTLSNEEKSLVDKYGLTFEQLNWRRSTIQNTFNGEEDNFRQEYPAFLEESFLTSGRPYFPVTKVRENVLKTQEENCKNGYFEWKDYGKEVEFVEDKDGWWKVFSEPSKDYNYRYVTGSDSAEGKIVKESEKKPDNSSCGVFDRLLNEEVATFCSSVDTDIFADEIYKASVYYGSACDCVERNSSGQGVLANLKKHGNINLYHKQIIGHENDQETEELGFQTNESSRDMMLTELRTWVKKDLFKSGDYEFWKECQTFVYNDKGKPMGAQGCFDDRVMKAGLEIQAALQAADLYPIEVEEKKDFIEPKVEDVIEQAWNNQSLSESPVAHF